MADENGDKTRKARVDSTQEQLRIMAGSKKEIEPPDNIKLNDDELFFFNRVIKEKAKSDWSDHEIDMAAIMAGHMYRLKLSVDLLAQEGDVIPSTRGVRTNPRKRQVEDSINAIIGMRRSLGIHSRALNGEQRENSKRNNIAKEVENIISDEDDLLASPVDFNQIN